MLIIDGQGQKLGVIDRDEALKIAQERELDLVEIAPNANPPVGKIIDFQKFKYDENKKEQLAKKHAKEVELKEIWLSPRIAEHDLQTRLNRVEEFLNDGNKVMFRVKFKGREMGHLEFGFNLLNKIFGKFDGKISVERAPKVEGRSITAIIGKTKAGKPAELVNQAINQANTNKPQPEESKNL